jgi:tRNA threonylcarbamoyladenosine biosynthesis protein TsaE
LLFQAECAEEDIQIVASSLALLVPSGSKVALEGEMGAGKTTVVRALYEAWGGKADIVSSPTYALVHQYSLPNNQNLWHADWYRVQSSLELEASDPHVWWNPRERALVEWGRGLEPPGNWTHQLDILILEGSKRLYRLWKLM